ncbi:polymeric immunoglobulin receptor-like [Paramormyrops kingsleyae]|uniref:polymeric immunoglobulin receptor-like n=1 Tax=Paramormyrops kingsleyae TaxID=1676925 RepID=UPI003B978398
MDPLMLLFLLIAGLTGADSVSTVKWVPVQRGGSVTIPCFYEDRYKTNVKYWCRGFYRDSCPPIVHSDSPQEGKVSIRDDQRVFTVTINNLTAGDSGSYWCGVMISDTSDVGEEVRLSVTDGSPRLSVDKQEVVDVEGDSVSVQCHYTDDSAEVKWCKAGGSCAAMTSGSLDGRPVLIRDDRVNGVFTVTMRGLERKDTGWYWCAAGNLQIPVHITVSQRVTATTSTKETIMASASSTEMVPQTVSAHDEEEGNDKNQKWEQVLDAVLKAGTGVFYLICTIIAIELHCSSCRKWGSNQREAEEGANTNHRSE